MHFLYFIFQAENQRVREIPVFHENSGRNSPRVSGDPPGFRTGTPPRTDSPNQPGVYQIPIQHEGMRGSPQQSQNRGGTPTRQSIPIHMQEEGRSSPLFRSGSPSSSTQQWAQQHGFPGFGSGFGSGFASEPRWTRDIPIMRDFEDMGGFGMEPPRMEHSRMEHTRMEPPRMEHTRMEPPRMDPPRSQPAGIPIMREREGFGVLRGSPRMGGFAHSPNNHHQQAQPSSQYQPAAPPPLSTQHSYHAPPSTTYQRDSPSPTYQNQTPPTTYQNQAPPSTTYQAPPSTTYQAPPSTTYQAPPSTTYQNQPTTYQSQAPPTMSYQSQASQPSAPMPPKFPQEPAQAPPPATHYQAPPTASPAPQQSPQPQSEPIPAPAPPAPAAMPTVDHLKAEDRMAKGRSPSPAPPNVSPLEHIEMITAEAKNLREKVESYPGTKKEKSYLYLEEMLTRLLIKLDRIESNGKDEIRKARKEGVRLVQGTLDQLELKGISNAAAMPSKTNNNSNANGNQNQSTNGGQNTSHVTEMVLDSEVSC